MVKKNKTKQPLASFINLYVDLLVLQLFWPSAAFSFLSRIFFTPLELTNGFFTVPEPTISVNDLQDRSDDDLRKLSQSKFTIPLLVYYNERINYYNPHR